MHQPILHIMSVGTSAFGKPAPPMGRAVHGAIHTIGKQSLISGTQGESWSGMPKNECRPRSAFDLDRVANELATRLSSLSPDEETGASPPGGADYLPAEISSLHVFYKSDADRRGEPEPLDGVLLLCSQTNGGYAAGQAVAKYLRGQGSRTGPKRAAFDGWLLEPTVHVVSGLASSDADAFERRGLVDLVDAVHGAVTQWLEGHPDGRIVVNPTGGYKGAIPHLVMLAAADERIEVVYKYETSDRPVRLPAMPLAFDLATYRDYRWLLRDPEALGEALAGIVAAAPRSVAALFDRTEATTPNALHRIVTGRYESRAQEALTPYGPGRLLLDLVADPFYHDLLSHHIVRWQSAWLGDQVTEMAEHQRGHTQRALELATQVLRPALQYLPDLFNPTELAVFIAAVWLHDIGHAGRFFEVEHRRFVVEGFPTLVRDWHHFLGSQMLAEDAGVVRKGVDGAFFSAKFRHNGSEAKTPPEFIEAVRLVTRHHRSRVPLSGERQSSKPLPDGSPVRAEDAEVTVRGQPVRWKLITSLYRLIDSADVQVERAGLLNYRRARESWEKSLSDFMLDEAEALLEGATHSLPAADGIGEALDAQTLRDWCGKLREALGKDDRAAIEALDKSLEAAVNGLAGRRAAGLIEPHCYVWWADVLRLLSSVAFKTRQPEHLEKHAGINSVVFSPRFDGPGSKLHIRAIAFVEEEGRSSGLAEDLSSELKDECAKELLEQAGLVFCPTPQEHRIE